MIGAVTPGSILVWARVQRAAFGRGRVLAGTGLSGHAAHASRGRARRRRLHRAHRVARPVASDALLVPGAARRAAGALRTRAVRGADRASGVERPCASRSARARACRSIRSSGSSTRSGRPSRISSSGWVTTSTATASGRSCLRRNTAASATSRRSSRCSPACRRSQPGTITTSVSTMPIARTPPARIRSACFATTGPIQRAAFADTPGVFFRYEYGGVDFFVLDGRYHRDPNGSPDGPGKTMLGAAQLAWLEAGLRASRAPFKLLVSGSGWSMADGPQGDTWAAFRHERDALFDFIRDQRHRRRRAALRRHTHRRAQLHPLVRARRLRPVRPGELAARAGDEPQLRKPDTRASRATGVFGRGQLRRARLRVGARAAADISPCATLAASAVWEPLTLAASELVNGRATCREKTTTA